MTLRREPCLRPRILHRPTPSLTAVSPVGYILAIKETRRYSRPAPLRPGTCLLSRPRVHLGRHRRDAPSASGVPRVVALRPSSLPRGRAEPTLLLEPAHGTQPAPVTRALCREIGVAALHTAGHTTTIRQKLGKGRSTGASVRQEGGGEVCSALAAHMKPPPLELVTPEFPGTESLTARRAVRDDMVAARVE